VLRDDIFVEVVKYNIVKSKQILYNDEIGVSYYNYDYYFTDKYL